MYRTIVNGRVSRLNVETLMRSSLWRPPVMAECSSENVSRGILDFLGAQPKC